MGTENGFFKQFGRYFDKWQLASEISKLNVSPDQLITIFPFLEYWDTDHIAIYKKYWLVGELKKGLKLNEGVFSYEGFSVDKEWQIKKISGVESLFCQKGGIDLLAIASNGKEITQRVIRPFLSGVCNTYPKIIEGTEAVLSFSDLKDIGLDEYQKFKSVEQIQRIISSVKQIKVSFEVKEAIKMLKTGDGCHLFVHNSDFATWYFGDSDDIFVEGMILQETNY